MSDTDNPDQRPERSWKMYVRGHRDRPMVAEYDCPVHGRFTLEVARDANGDPPARMSCDRRLTVIDSVVQYESVGQSGSVCGLTSPHVISATRGARVRKVEVVRGGYQKAERETWTDTTNLGEGQELEDWQADRDKVWEREREREVMQLAKEIG